MKVMSKTRMQNAAILMLAAAMLLGAGHVQPILAQDQNVGASFFIDPDNLPAPLLPERMMSRAPNPTNPPPDLIQSETDAMVSSPMSV